MYALIIFHLGLLAASVLHRLGGKGTVLHVISGEGVPTVALDAFGFDDTMKAPLLAFPMEGLGALLGVEGSAHDIPAPAALVAELRSESKSEEPCRKFLAGICEYSDKCRYSHAPHESSILVDNVKLAVSMEEAGMPEVAEGPPTDPSLKKNRQTEAQIHARAQRQQKRVDALAALKHGSSFLCVRLLVL